MLLITTSFLPAFKKCWDQVYQIGDANLYFSDLFMKDFEIQI